MNLVCWDKWLSAMGTKAAKTVEVKIVQVKIDKVKTDQVGKTEETSGFVA